MVINTLSNTAINPPISTVQTAPLLTGAEQAIREEECNINGEQNTPSMVNKNTRQKYSRFIKKIDNIQNKPFCSPLFTLCSPLTDANGEQKNAETELISPIIPICSPVHHLNEEKRVIDNISVNTHINTRINTYIYKADLFFRRNGEQNISRETKVANICQICGEKPWIKTDVFLCEKCYKKQVVKPMKKQPEILPPENAVKCPDCGLPWATAGTYETMNGRTYNHHCKYCGMCNNI